MLGVAAVQVAHPLAARLPPVVQEAIGDGVVLEHDVVHVSVPLGTEGRRGGDQEGGPGGGHCLTGEPLV